MLFLIVIVLRFLQVLKLNFCNWNFFANVKSYRHIYVLRKIIIYKIQIMKSNVIKYDTNSPLSLKSKYYDKIENPFNKYSRNFFSLRHCLFLCNRTLTVNSCFKLQQTVLPANVVFVFFKFFWDVESSAVIMFLILYFHWINFHCLNLFNVISLLYFIYTPDFLFKYRFEHLQILQGRKFKKFILLCSKKNLPMFTLVFSNKSFWQSTMMSGHY